MSPEQASVLARAPKRADGEPLNLFATLARSPELMRRVNALGGYFGLRGLLDAHTRELAILRVAGRTASRYELAHHRPQALRAGLDRVAVEAAIDASSAHLWPAQDAAVLAFVDALLDADVACDDAWEALQGKLSDDQLMELTLLTGFYRMLASTLNTLRVELDATG